MFVVAVAVGILVVGAARRARRHEWVLVPRWWRLGRILIVGGVAVYVMVRAVNHGVTPSTADALRTAGRTTITRWGDPVGKLQQHRFRALGDVIAWPAPLPFASVVGVPQLVALVGLPTALRMPRRAPAVNKIELTAGQFWWDAPNGGDERLEVSVPGGVLRTSDARLGVEVGPRGGILIVIEGSVLVEGPRGEVQVDAGHGLDLAPDGPTRVPQPLDRSEIEADEWISPHLAEPSRRRGPLLHIDDRGWPLPAILAGLVLVLMTASTYVAQITTVPSASMEPNLSPGNRILVAKAAGAPARGDVVVFERPRTMTTGPALLVKRVIAVGGQTVRVDDGHVYVDDRRISEPYLPPETETTERCGVRGSVRVPAGRFFVLGDNRSESFDSRCFGPVSGSAVVGSVVVRVFPPGGTD